MPATALRCRNCETDHALEAVAVCTRCWGPLDPVYDPGRTVTREGIEAGPPSIWRYADLLPVAPPAEQRLAPGLTPLVRADRLADEVGVGELWLKLDTANPTHSFKDRVVAVATAKAQELGLTTIACSSTGNLANAVAARAAAEGLEAAVFCPADLEPEKLTATAAYGATLYKVAGTYDDCNRITIELSWEVDWGFVNVGLRSYYAEGSKTIGFEIAEQLGWQTPDVVVSPIASGSLYTKLNQAFTELRELGLVEGAVPRLIGGQAKGCSPVATAFETGAGPAGEAGHRRALACDRHPADGDLAVATARATNGAVHAVAEDAVGECMALLAGTSGVFGETAAGVTLGALRAAVAAGEVGADDRVVLLVTGDGLKTPGAVAFTYQPIEIEADVDAVCSVFRPPLPEPKLSLQKWLYFL